METELTAPVTLDADLRQKLERAAEQSRALAARALAANDERDALIREAAAGGASLREIGEAVGLSHMGVSKILKRDQR